jgi:hypothetical protein
MKKQFKNSASAARAFGTSSPAFGFSSAPAFGTSSSPLSYLNELPDLSSISDPNIVVAFKSLSKRDATTKSKALEDLQGLLLEDGKEIEDGVLEAWTSIYPRTSIDSSRRVRHLAHALQGHIVSRSGKRIAKRMPSVVGAWLAGAYDSDKVVARAASEALSQVFTTQEKRQAVWKAYQDPLLEFSRNVFDKESPQTLSDERSVSPDEANAKYFRVVTSAVGLLSNLLADLKEEDFKKNETQYTEILQDKKLWDKALSDDVTVRRSMHKMLRNLLQSPQIKSCLDLALLSGIYITKGVDSDQFGSAGYYLEALLALTASDPTIWTDQWKDKKQPSSRLRALVKRGSQGAALNYWSSVLKLFRSIPVAAFPTDPDKAREVIKAFHSGITRKEEPTPYIAEGLKAYVQVATIVSAALPEDARASFLHDSVLPLFSQYLSPKVENAKWNIPPNAASTLIQDVLKSKDLAPMIFDELPATTADLVREIRLSLPEQAKEYSRSQDELAKTGERFAGLAAVLVSTDSGSEHLQKATADLLKEAFEVVVNRNGKPYGAASFASAIISQCRSLIDQSVDLSTIVEEFLEKKTASIYVSPSYKQLAAILASYEEKADIFIPAWTACLDAALTSRSDLQFELLSELLTSRKSVSEAELDTLGRKLAPVVLLKVDAIWTAGAEWNTFLPLLAKSAIAVQLFAEPVLDRITASLLGSSEAATVSLDGLRGVSMSTPSILKSFLGSECGKKLLPNLLLLSESPDEGLAKGATEHIPVVQTLLGNNISSGASGNAVIDVIQSGLSSAGPTSVSIDTLVSHAKGLLNDKMVESFQSLLPSDETWSEALQSFFPKTVDKSLAITSPFGGAVFLVGGSAATSQAVKVERDAEGLSVPLRMAMYTVKLLTSVTDESTIVNRELNQLLTLATSLVNDHLTVAAPSNLWSSNDPEIVSEISDFVSAAQQLLKSWYEKDGVNTLAGITAKEDLSSRAYYLALASGRMQAEQEEAHGGSSSADTEELEKQLKGIRQQGNVFAIVSHLYGHQVSLADSSAVMRYCNELVADLTPLDAGTLQESGLPQFVILNTILTYYEDAGETIAKARLSRFVSKAIGWLQDEAIEDELVAELYRTMFHLLPHVSDMYGDYWSNVLESIKSTLELVSELPDANAPALIPVLNASLRLFGVLRRIKSSESAKAEDERNDDIIEAWNGAEGDINAAMEKSLKVPRLNSDEQHQPLMIFNELLSREISRIPTSKLTDVEELYPQLYSLSPAIQQAAYRLLHRYIPSNQEQISLDTVLDKTKARLPDELLSLILETPVAADLHEEDFERSTPLQLRGYLLSWLLVFDHFTNASHKVKNDYVESMKDAGHLGDFLDFTFDFLGHGKGRPLDVSKFDVASYNTSTMEDSPLKDAQWLLTHLYYLCLTYFPALSKTWWIECKARQKVISVESWTAKHIAPLVISTAIEGVASWARTQDTAHTSEEPPPLEITINHQASELKAAYSMDDDGQSAIIVVALPSTFPLHNAKVTSPSKSMAVDERRWNSWLLNSQAIIAVSGNSIVDGLLAWRRNVFGALKGQTECAICYAVVGEDGRVPSKKCRTCKNSFHGSCLFKWFKSSNGTSCPLCRESFNYG